MIRKTNTPAPKPKPEAKPAQIGETDSTPENQPGYQRLLWQGKILPAVWTVGSVLSIVLNVILLVVVLVLVRYLFTIKTLVGDGLINGLYDNFVMMEQAHIKTTIEVKDTIQVVDTIPVVFDLPLKTDTTVILTEDIPIPNTQVHINTGVISLNAPATVVLPRGTALNIALDLMVPVSQTIPIVLNVPVSLVVPVDIPLEQTELSQPFRGLQGVVAPYRTLLNTLPSTWENAPMCKTGLGWLCKSIFAPSVPPKLDK